MLDPATPWPPNLLDAMSPDARAAEGISSFRTEVGSNYLAGIFRTPDDLASQASVAVAVQGLSLQMAERLLAQTNVTDDMGGFGAGSRFDDDTDPTSSSVESIASLIKRMVASARTSRALVLDLGGDYGWWSTRLFLLANLLRTLTPIRQIVFRTADGRFAGMASPAAVVDGLAEAFPILDKFRRSFRQRPEDQDTDRATDRQLALWEKLFPESSPERDIKVRISPELLRRWIGDRLITSCIQIADTGPTMAQIQQIVESLIADVPVERQPRDAPDNWELGVVDRNAFSMELAREWVRSSLPRTTIR